MTIKSIVDPKPPVTDSMSYPKLMRYKYNGTSVPDLIVLAIERFGGSIKAVVMESGTEKYFGGQAVVLDADKFSDFEGRVTLANKK